MGLIVQKFGGTSVKDRDRIFNVARIVANTRNQGNDVVVVVSAQGDTTDDLITKAAEITSDPSHREMDMLLATGEQISISLLAMALQEIGVPSVSLTGWQAGFNTDRAYTKARIKRLNTERVESELARNRVVVVAGFQGLNRSDDIILKNEHRYEEVSGMKPIVNTPVYHQSAAYAREHGELDQFRQSHQANIACKKDIEEAIFQNFDGMGSCTTLPTNPRASSSDFALP